MLKKRIIPCLDMRDGRVVKGIQFENIRDAGDPVETARRYSQLGADEITFLDINATHEGRSTMFDVVERTAEQVFIRLPWAAASAILKPSAKCRAAERTKFRSTPRPCARRNSSKKGPCALAASALWCPLM